MHVTQMKTIHYSGDQSITFTGMIRRKFHNHRTLTGNDDSMSQIVETVHISWYMNYSASGRI